MEIKLANGVTMTLVQKVKVEKRRVVTDNDDMPIMLTTEDGKPIYALPGGGQYIPS